MFRPALMASAAVLLLAAEPCGAVAGSSARMLRHTRDRVATGLTGLQARAVRATEPTISRTEEVTVDDSTVLNSTIKAISTLETNLSVVEVHITETKQIRSKEVLEEEDLNRTFKMFKESLLRELADINEKANRSDAVAKNKSAVKADLLHEIHVLHNMTNVSAVKMKQEKATAANQTLHAAARLAELRLEEKAVGSALEQDITARLSGYYPGAEANVSTFAFAAGLAAGKAAGEVEGKKTVKKLAEDRLKEADAIADVKDAIRRKSKADVVDAVTKALGLGAAAAGGVKEALEGLRREAEAGILGAPKRP